MAGVTDSTPVIAGMAPGAIVLAQNALLEAQA